MDQNDKLRVVTNFSSVSKEIQEQIKLTYPEGFSEHLIEFTNKDGERVSALRFETDEKIYLLKMSKKKAQQIIEDDTDYDNDGRLKDDVLEDYEDKYSDLDYISDNQEEGDD